MVNSKFPAAPTGVVVVVAQPAQQEPSATMVDAMHDDIVDVWGLDSFPASDPPANW